MRQPLKWLWVVVKAELHHFVFPPIYFRTPSLFELVFVGALSLGALYVAAIAFGGGVFWKPATYRGIGWDGGFPGMLMFLAGALVGFRHVYVGVRTKWLRRRGQLAVGNQPGDLSKRPD